MNPQAVHEFQEQVWDHYRKHARDLPWRHEPFEPYHILLSEIMLQQTQVSRVTSKYESFLDRFPTIQSLADAPLAEVLIAWSGLGYNRRAKYLHEAAKQLALLPTPWQLTDLTNCKGIGYNTAAAVITYAHNQALPFIETNVRTVLIHHFFNDAVAVGDRELIPILEAVLDREHPREFMWAIMDYGSHLKTTVGNLSRQSKHYAKQSTFEGSVRQLRGAVLRKLAEGEQSERALLEVLADDRLPGVLADLVQEGLVSRTGDKFVLGQ